MLPVLCQGSTLLLYYFTLILKKNCTDIEHYLHERPMIAECQRQFD